MGQSSGQSSPGGREEYLGDVSRPLSSLLTSPCGNPAASVTSASVFPRVVGGHVTSAEYFPWTVAIHDWLTNNIVCGGAILTEHLVITAAHCFHGHPQASLYYIMAGKSKLLEYESWQQMTFIDQIIMHEGFNASSYENDIALVRVKTPFTLQTPTVRPVCFPASTHTLPAGTLCYLAGFGDTLGTGTDEVLNYMRVPVIEDEVCARQDFHGVDFSPAGTFCAGYVNGGPDACTGDSGSGLVTKHTDGLFYVYGVSSWGSGCGEARRPGVYTDVLHYISWVYGKFLIFNRNLPFVG
ncbi:hypothetical protein C0Q70_00023 [Pomacea canaliculata]|uniref:Peptidase S1 domain-containing protein n=1 Tax=Pomacea canaliculata TaxID=400727 RepID=A0A2T7PVI9_POMCA|nr:hypothetical protein C0Q70_00023 [Pomacea canaliculata]